MKRIKFLLAPLCLLALSNSWAFVTFFNNISDSSISVTYELCPSGVGDPKGICSSTYTTKEIPEKTAYRDNDIQLCADSGNMDAYYELYVTSVKITHPDKSTQTIDIPGVTLSNGNKITPCGAYENTGVLFQMLTNSPSEVFCSTGSG